MAALPAVSVPSISSGPVLLHLYIQPAEGDAVSRQKVLALCISLVRGAGM